MSVKHIKSTNIVKGNLYKYNEVRYETSKSKLETMFLGIFKTF